MGSPNEVFDSRKTECVPHNTESDDTRTDVRGSCYHGFEIHDENNDDTQPLPEDAFHSQDALSRHLLEQQKSEQCTDEKEVECLAADGAAAAEHTHKANDGGSLVLSLV